VNNIIDALKTSVVEYCCAIGTDPLLVQGAGGNVSWKDEDTLWVKASGTWLGEAAEKNIFVPVDLLHARNAIENGDFSVTPRLSEVSDLRPSIETLLHALMPHRVVVHLHAIEILAHLVRDNCESDFKSLLDATIQWAAVDYCKPGAPLATAVGEVLAQNPGIDVVFLKNHGVVIGGDGVSEVSHTLKGLITALSTVPASVSNELYTEIPVALDEYSPVQDQGIHQLALNNNYFSRLDSDWAIYPDHVVFLGVRAFAYKSWDAFIEEYKNKQVWPELVFILGHGVFVKPTFNGAKCAQLRCYYDVLSRLDPHQPVKSLVPSQVAELLNWDAEQYRQLIAK